MYEIGTKYFTTNELSVAIVQAWVADLRINNTVGYNGCPRIIATRNGNDRIDQENDTFVITLSVENASSSLHLSFADAANHATRSREQLAPDTQLLIMVRETLQKLELECTLNEKRS